MKTVLKHECKFCASCPLRRQGATTVYVPTEIFYRDIQENGSPCIDVLVVGEAPGYEEDTQGRPFVGDTGREVRQAIEEAGLAGTTAYGNIVRCRPREGNKNRAPILEEVTACRNYLLQDIEYLKPKVVILMGNTVVQAILPSLAWKDKGINSLKGDYVVKDGVTYLATIHPYSFLHNKSYIERKQFFTHIKNAAKLVSGVTSSMARKGVSTLLDTKEDVNDFVDLVKTMPKDKYEFLPGIGLDTETDNLNRIAPNDLLSIQFALDNDTGFVIPVKHPGSPFREGDNLNWLINVLTDLFTYADAPFEYWLAHNGKFDGWQVLRLLGLKRLPKPILDTLYLEYLCDENLRSKDDNVEGIGTFASFDLKTLSKDKLGFRHYNQDVLKAREEPSGMSKLPLYENGKEASDFVDYGGMDAYVGRRIACLQVEELRRQKYLDKAMRLALKWDARITHLYEKEESNGIFLDQQQLEYLGSDKSPILGRLLQIPKEILATPEGKKANDIVLRQDPKTAGMKPLLGRTPIVWEIGKPAHKRALLIDACGLEPVGYGKDEVTPSVDRKFYEYHEGHELTQLVHDYVGLEKLRTSYINSIYRELDRSEDNKVDNRIHASFHSTRTVTGRGATTNPNIGQVPKETSFEKAMIKSMYGASPGHVIFEADYMQSEVRWWAQVSNDLDFAAMFKDMLDRRKVYLANPTPEGAKEVELYCDSHRQVGAMMHQIELAEVTKDQRQGAKRLVFGSIYGQNYKTLASLLKITPDKALHLQTMFLTRFKRAGAWLTEIEAFAEKYRYVESPFGRRRHLDPAFKVDPNGAKRQARNSPLQAASSDNMFLAAWRFQTWLEDNDLDRVVRIVNTVHDAILVEVPLDFDLICLVRERLEYFMTNIEEFLLAEFGIKLIVPFEADFKIGVRWGHCLGVDVTNLKKAVNQCEDWDEQLRGGKPWHEIASTLKKAV